MRPVAEQHAVGGGQRQRVAARFLPRQMPRPVHQLLGLDAAELGETAVGRLVTPDALARREHGIAAVALLVIAVVLVAVHQDLVADIPARDFAADLPDHTRGVRAGHVVVLLVHVEDRNRLAQRSPDAVVVDARRHHQHQHFVAVDIGRVDHFHLHGLFRLALTFAADHPGIHFLGHMSQRRDLADLIEVLDFTFGNDFAGLGFGCVCHFVLGAPAGEGPGHFFAAQ